MEITLDQSLVLVQIQEQVQQRFMYCHDSAHGWDHVYRVYRLAEYIAVQEGADRFIVGMAVLMHDLGHTVECKGNEHHVDLSAKLASELMLTYQLPTKLQDAIIHAILAHSFSRGLEPCTLEAGVVRDADRLDALGAIGIMRWGIVGGQRAKTGRKPYQLDDPFAERHPLDDDLYMLDHFSTKLLKLEEGMMTETGLHLAQRRTDFMRQYLAEFKHDLELS
jgi:uncharacterized protein